MISMTEFIVSIESDGVIRLPAQLRAKHGIRTGDSFQISDFGECLVLIPRTPSVAVLAKDIERARSGAALDMRQALKSLRKQRKRYYAEKYKRAQ